MSTTDPKQAATKRPPTPSVDDIFGNRAALSSAEDLAHDGIFDDGEVDEFISDLYAMRRVVLMPTARALAMMSGRSWPQARHPSESQHV